MTIKFRYNSPAILTFALISALALGLNALTGGWANSNLFSTYRDSLTDPLMYVRLFGHVLGHASWSHYMSNMLMVLLLGPMLEEKYGSKVIVEMIAITAVVTAVIHNVFFPGVALLGASGIAFMLIVLSSIANVRKGEIPITFILICIFYIGGELVAAFKQDNISQLGHIIGGTCGGFFGLFLINGKR